MSVSMLGLIKPGRTYVCPKPWAFSIKITLWLILHFFENRRLVCPKLRAFSELCLLSLSVGFFNRPGRTYIATLQCLSWLLEDQICLLAFSTEFERHTLQRWVSRNVGLGLSIGLFQIVQDSFVQKLAYFENRLLFATCVQSWFIFKFISSIFVPNLAYFKEWLLSVSFFVQKLALFPYS